MKSVRLGRSRVPCARSKPTFAKFSGRPRESQGTGLKTGEAVVLTGYDRGGLRLENCK